MIRKDTVDKATNPQSCFATLARAQTILSASGDLPVPRVLALETGKDVLGAPFLAMEFVTGQIPSDVPSYAAGGWVRDALPGQRRRMWESGLDFMVALHALDWRALRLGELRFEEAGRDDVERCLKRSINLYRQEAGDRVSDLAERAIAWLITNRPETAESCICWGDARIGNMIWRDFTPAAVIDWEMASLGVPAMDLGWWSFFHRWATSGQGHAVLEGMPVGTELAALYAARGGRPIDDILYYEILATVRGLSIWIRTYDVMTAGTPAAEASPIADGVHIMTVLDTLMTDIPTRKTG